MWKNKNKPFKIKWTCLKHWVLSVVVKISIFHKENAGKEEILQKLLGC